MSPPLDDPDPSPSGDPDPAPELTIACRRCDREWDLSDELATVGNQAPEQFALDHRRHTGHFPDGVATWRIVCRHCPEEAERLDEAPARRWAETHARHTRHDVEIRRAAGDEVTVVEG